MNNINITGRLVKRIEPTQGRDSLFARFTLAVYRDKEHTDFIPCVAFGKTVETLNKYTDKGSQIGIEGRLQSGKYTNNEGRNIYTLDVIVSRVELLGSKPQEDKATHEANYQTREPMQQPSYSNPGYQQTLTNDGYDLNGYQDININTDELPFY